MADALTRLVGVARARAALATDAPAESFTRASGAPGEPMYTNRHRRLGIDFAVERLPFPDAQTLDPRIVRIAPGCTNERHKHAHESLFVVLEGEGEVEVGAHVRPIRTGDLAFVPRWAFHRTRNTSDDVPLVVLAITDFGFTSTVLGDYDRRTRLADDGADSRPS